MKKPSKRKEKNKHRNFWKKKEDKIIEQQSKRTFNQIHKSCTIFDSYTNKQNEFVFGKPNYLGFAVLALNNLLIYGPNYDKF